MKATVCRLCGRRIEYVRRRHAWRHIVPLLTVMDHPPLPSRHEVIESEAELRFAWGDR